MVTQYRFTAKNWQGQRVSGTISTTSSEEVVNNLRSRNLVPLDIKEQRYWNLFQRGVILTVLKKLGFRQYNSRDLMIFCRQFSTMLQAGVSLLHTLIVLSGQMDKQVIRLKLQSAAVALEEGTCLAYALRQQHDFFPPLLINMIEAGEAGGMLEVVMERMADHYEKQHDLEEKIRSATVYPIFITAVAFIVVVVMITFVLPQFANIFNSIGMEMPFLSRMLLAAGENAVRYWPLIVMLLLFTYFTMVCYTRTEKGRLNFDHLRLHLPLYGKIYSQTIAARFARTLGTLLASGVTLHNALKLVDKIVNNRTISHSINELCNALNRGETMAGSMQTNRHFPSLLVEMVRVGEETGALDQTLHRTAVFYEREVTYVVERLSSILEPALLLIVGLFIGLLVFSILSPMYQVFEMI